MFDYAGLAGDAAALIAEFGTTAVLRRSVAGDYDPNFGEVDDNGTQTFTTVGVRTSFRKSDVDGTQILATDVRLLLSPSLAVTPQSGDVIVFAGETYTVVASTPLNPAGIVLLHDVQARGG